eukprot:15466847-Alexandrium_andersonii.AAC.1
MATGSVQSCVQRWPPLPTPRTCGGRSLRDWVGRCPCWSASLACSLTHSSPARLPTDPMSSSSVGLPLGNRVSMWNDGEARVTGSGAGSVS